VATGKKVIYPFSGRINLMATGSLFCGKLCCFSWRCGLAAALALGLTIVRPDPNTKSADAPRVSTAARVPLYAELVAANNPVQLTVLVDPVKLVGWVGGTKDLAGEQVQIAVGRKSHFVRVEAGNTFSWPYKVEQPASAVVAVAGLKSYVTLKPPTQAPPSVFFIVDRPVYRPNQALQFAAYLRQQDLNGEFLPLPRRQVEIHLTSQQKKTTAARLSLASDEMGRIAGIYTFSNADPLDTYELSIPDYKGTAQIALAEYRKSKIKLRIAGEREGDRVRLRFEALDFLGQPVAGSKVQFTAQVVRNSSRPETGDLKAADFVYASDMGPTLPLMEDFDEDQQLLAKAGQNPALFLSHPGPTVVSTVQGEVVLPGKDACTYSLPLPRGWKDARHSVVVQGVLIDANGHEQRCTQTIPLGVQEEESLRLRLPKDVFAVNEAIQVTAQCAGKQRLEVSATLVALRLSPNPSANTIDTFSGYLSSSIPLHANSIYWGYSAAPYAWRYSSRRPTRRSLAAEVEEPLRRTMVTAVAFRGDTATLRLGEPGAYKLVAILESPAGEKIRQEVGCVVHGDDRPALTLQLDRTALDSGEHLRGVVHSRFADARVLLSVRDSTGYLTWKTLQMAKGSADVDVAMPAHCRYGCYVDVQYEDAPQGEDTTHIASQFIHIRPCERLMTVETHVKPVVNPGEKVSLEVKVNRKEQVDLVVSIYDQALLGIRPDRSADPASFYLADEHVRASHAMDVLRRRLGGVTLRELLNKARKMLPHEHDNDGSEEVAALRTLVQRRDGKEPMRVYDVATLLRLAGIKLELLNPWYSGNQCLIAENTHPDTALADLLQTETNGWRLQFFVFEKTVLLAEHHSSWGPNSAPYMRSLAAAHLAGYGNINAFQASGNSVYSTSAQAMYSHVAPIAAMPAVPLEAGQDQPGLSVRRDFSDSAYWSALVRTDDEGKAHVEFKVPDSLTNWQVVVTAISKDLHVGRGRGHFQTFKPVMVWPMLPRVFTEGDRVDVFASVHNRSEVEQTLRVRLKVDNGDVLTPAEQQVTIGPNSNAPVYWTFRPGKASFTQLLMSAECAAGSDASLKRLPVLRAGAEQLVTASGFCKDFVEVKLPEGIDPTAATLEVHFAPSLAADLVDTLDYLVEYPYGCVEQTMSRFLPAIEVAKVLQRYQINHDGLNRKLPGCVQGGIKRLLELQQPDGGWGWNGSGQTHEMMTPYALFGLLQAEKAGYVLGSDQAVERGLVRLRQFIDQMGPPQVADRVFCMYVYGHRKEMLPEWWQFLAEQLGQGRLSDCALALALELAVQCKKEDLAGKLARRLRERAETVNCMTFWKTAGFSRWADDQFEVTAAALKALVAYDKDDPLIPRVLSFFAATKRGNRWNSTKDTAMIVYAMCDYLSRKEVRPDDKPQVSFRCNDSSVTPVVFAERALGQKIVVPAEHVRAGANRITFTDGSAGMMYRLVLRYHLEGRNLAPAGHGVRVARQFWLLDEKGQRKRQLKTGDAVPRGAYVESFVSAEHLIGQPMNYVLVENPKPSCCEILPADDVRFHQNSTPFVLREEREGLVAYHHESTPQLLSDRCVLHAELAGEYVVAPAHVELMYHTETTGHSGTFVLRVADEAR
jgi:hypothetical protein